MLKRTLSLLTLLVVLGALLAACGGAPASQAPAAESTAATAAEPNQAEAAAPTTAPEDEATEEATPESAEAATEVPPTPTAVDVSTFNEAEAGDRTVIRWFVGLGTGGDPQQIEAQQKAVEDFNASQDRIYLALRIVQNTQAVEALTTQIAAGDAPDIVGPVGIAGQNSFAGQWLDLSDLVKSANLDLSEYDEKLIEFWDIEGQGQIGLPFAVFPSFVYFNKDLFDEAGVPYPPQKYGDQYEGKEWNMDTVKDLAKTLTVDEAGNDATSAEFDPTKIEQFGFAAQYGTEPRAWATLFGAENVVGEGNKAQIPDNWRTAWKWIHDAMHKEHFMPNNAYIQSDLLGGNPFNSGNVAMAYTHLWYTCCITPGENVKNWDIAITPMADGQLTAKLHADTFSILKSTENPNEAFEVLSFLINNGELLQAYGAFPAKKSLQEDFLANLDEKFAPNKVNWQVAIDSLQYPDIPSHEGNMPNFNKAADAFAAFEALYMSEPDLDIDAEVDTLQTELQTIFDEAQ